MSHDIGALRGLVEAHIAAGAEERARGLALAMAVNDCLREAFGEVSGWFGPIGQAVRVTFDRKAGRWLAVTWRPDDSRVEAFADTPRAAVTQAIAALEVTHPTEAAALAAVIPPEKS